MKSWIKDQFEKRRWTVVAAGLVLCYLLAWGGYLYLASVTGYSCDPETALVNVNDICFTKPYRIASAVLGYFVHCGSTLIMAFAVLSLFDRDRISRALGITFVLLDLFPFLFFGRFALVFMPFVNLFS